MGFVPVEVHLTQRRLQGFQSAAGTRNYSSGFTVGFGTLLLC